MDRPEIHLLAEWLQTPQDAALLWVRGPCGSGRTTAVGTAIRDASSLALPVKRVCCREGGSLEELLGEVADFLAQLGSSTLGMVLDQRANIQAKISVLFQSLRECPMLLWIDDLDVLQLEFTVTRRDSEPIECLLEGCRSLEGSASRVLIVSHREAPSPGTRTIDVGPLSTTEADTVWRREGGPGLPGGLPPSWRRDAFTTCLLARVAARLPPQDIESLLADESDPLERALAVSLEELSPRARDFLCAASVLPPEPSRQAVREVAPPPQGPQDLSRPRLDPVLSEIEKWGLARLPDDASGDLPPLYVHPHVRAFLHRRVLPETSRRWRELQALVGGYYLRLASKSANLWHYVECWRRFTLAGLNDEAYKLQKAFLEEILRRGYLDMARNVLERTVRTSTGLARAVTLGNLAITYKNAGDHKRALATYEDVRSEFEALGDLPNVARVYHQIGNTHYTRGDHGEALASYERSLEISTEIDDKLVAVATRIQIANVHYQMKNLQQSLQQYQQAIEDTRALGAHALTSAVALQIGQIHLQEKRYLEAEGILKEAETAAQAAGDTRSTVKVLQAQGTLASRRREYDTARERFERALWAAESLGDACEMSASLVLAGDLEKTRLQLADALGCYLKAREVLTDGKAAASAATPAIHDFLEKIEERVRALSESIGEEAFARILRKACGEGSLPPWVASEAP